jgi:hypothetical protein
MPDITTVTADSFRVAFPAFADDLAYLGPEIDFWIALGTNMINVGRWGNLASFGLQLFVAHNLSLEAARCGQGAASGPGAILGPLTSATVDKVSYSRDSSAAMDPKNGHWNLTTYGLRYIQLVRMVGAGPLHIGAPLGASNYGYGGAWPGPDIYPPMSGGI